MTATAEVTLDRAPEGVPGEDESRAAIYGLVAALFSAAPTAQLLDTIARADGVIAEDAQSGLARAWRALRDAAARACPDSVREEYDTAFVGAGRAPVSLYGLSHLDGTQREKLLVVLRDDLARLGLARRADCGDTEYHVAALCEVMRHLVAGGRTDEQQELFRAHVEPWYARCCDAIVDAPQTDFYKHVARFTREYFDIEAQLLELA
jgi:TorA maturation chaperone TorD